MVLKDFGVLQAKNYHVELENLFETLSYNPESARELEEIDPPVRVHPHGSHVIIYVIENSEDVLIIRVRHGWEDWKNDPI